MKNGQIFARKSTARGSLDLEYLDETSRRKVSLRERADMDQQIGKKLKHFTDYASKETLGQVHVGGFLGSIRSFVFRAGLSFLRLVRFCQGAVASNCSPRTHSIRCQPHLLNLSPNWIANWLAAILHVSGVFFHDLVMFRKAR